MTSDVSHAAGPTNTAAPKGRPREFDQDAVLDAVVQLFWQQGYEATSVSDVVNATGLNKSSLYNAFGSKEELLQLALNRYVDFRTGMVTSLLGDGSGGLDDVGRLLDALWEEVATADDHRGCLAVNTSTELGLRDDRVVAAGLRYRSRLRAALLAAFNRAADRGEIRRQDAETFTNIMLSFVLGTAVIVRSGAGNEEIRTQLDAARAMLDSWRRS